MEGVPLLKNGDIIWLNHSEKDATLASSKDVNLDKQGSAAAQKEALNVEFVNSNISDNFQQYSGNTNGMWVIESQDFRVGGFVQWDTSYRLKHFISGLYLGIKSSRGTQGYSMIMSIYPDKSTLFTFEKVLSATHKLSPYLRKYITKDTFVTLRNNETSTYLKLQVKQN